MLFEIFVIPINHK